MTMDQYLAQVVDNLVLAAEKERNADSDDARKSVNGAANGRIETNQHAKEAKDPEDKVNGHPGCAQGPVAAAKVNKEDNGKPVAEVRCNEEENLQEKPPREIQRMTRGSDRCWKSTTIGGPNMVFLC